MEWWIVLSIFFGGLLILFALGVPVAFAFGLLNVVLVLLFVAPLGDFQPLLTIARSAFRSVCMFSFIAVPLFLFIGDLLFHSGVALDAVYAIRTFMGKRIKGIYYYVAIIAGCFLGTVTGSSMAATAAMGTTLVPDGMKEGYDKKLLTGCICGSGSLAQIIPPSIFMVIFAGLASISAGKLLIAGFLPGVLIGAFFMVFVMITLWIKPELAGPPHKEKAAEKFSENVGIFVRKILPLGILFAALSVAIYAGFGTPTEAAAIGSVVSVVIVAAYRKLNWRVLRTALFSSMKTTSMVFLIVAGSKAFSEVLAWTQAGKGVMKVISSIPVSPTLTLIIMMLILVILGCFIEGVSIMFITVPLYYPVATTFGWDPLWFGLLMVMSINSGVITPPFGLSLFMMKGIAPPGVSYRDIVLGVLPFCLVYAAGILAIIFFPSIALILPSFM